MHDNKWLRGVQALAHSCAIVFISISIRRNQIRFERQPMTQEVHSPSTTNHSASSIVCFGCSSPNTDELNQCRHCSGFYCETCSCNCEQRPGLASLLSSAKTVAKPSQGALGFTIEDDCGVLEHLDGDLLSIMVKGQEPGEIFADYLLPDINTIYEAAQQGVWKNPVAKVRISLNSDWSVEITPMLVREHKYTVSWFILNVPSKGGV